MRARDVRAAVEAALGFSDPCVFSRVKLVDARAGRRSPLSQGRLRRLRVPPRVRRTSAASTYFAIAGIAAGIIGTRFRISGVDPVIAPYSIVLSFGIAVAVGVFFGFYPANRAALLRPIESVEVRVTTETPTEQADTAVLVPEVEGDVWPTRTRRSSLRLRMPTVVLLALLLAGIGVWPVSPAEELWIGKQRGVRVAVRRRRLFPDPRRGQLPELWPGTFPGSGGP